MMQDATDLFESGYVYIGKDEHYHIKDDAPDELKKRFNDFFNDLETTEENGLVSQA
jgi:hypothetical protein